MGYLLPGMVAITFLWGVAWLALAWRRGDIGRPAALGAAILALASLALLWPAASEAPPSLAWIAGLAPIGLHRHPPAVYLVVGVYWLLALTLWRTPGIASDRDRFDNAYWPGLAYLLCALIVVALSVDQFLARYVVLELVAVGTLALYWLGMIQAGRPPYSWLWRRYFLFRLGDAGLLLAILLLYAATDTFVIDRMLAEAALLSSAQQIPIVLAALLAVWVKMGLPPFQHWILESASLRGRQRLWVVGAGLPLLGAYLLYRFAPLLRDLNAHPFTAVLGLALLLKAGLALYRCGPARRASPWWLVAHGALGLLLVPTPWMALYLWSYLPLRLAISASMAGARVPAACWAAEAEGAFLRCSRAVPCWACHLEESLTRAENGLLFGSGGARLARRLEEGLGEGLNRRIGDGAVNLAHWSLYRLEQRLLEGLNRIAARVALLVGRGFQRKHAGKLRRNMAWAVSVMFVLVLIRLLT